MHEVCAFGMAWELLSKIVQCYNVCSLTVSHVAGFPELLGYEWSDRPLSFDHTPNCESFESRQW